MMVRCPESFCRYSNKHRTEEYFADISQAYREEIRDLYAAGCRKLGNVVPSKLGPRNLFVGNIQIDDPLLAYFCAESMIKGMEARGIDHEALLNLYIKVYNDCLEGKPADLIAGLHLCRGNFKV